MIVDETREAKCPVNCNTTTTNTGGANDTISDTTEANSGTVRDISAECHGSWNTQPQSSSSVDTFGVFTVLLVTHVLVCNIVI